MSGFKIKSICEFVPIVHSKINKGTTISGMLEVGNKLSKLSAKKLVPSLLNLKIVIRVLNTRDRNNMFSVLSMSSGRGGKVEGVEVGMRGVEEGVSGVNSGV
jgi:hypothetical protein